MYHCQRVCVCVCVCVHESRCRRSTTGKDLQHQNRHITVSTCSSRSAYMTLSVEIMGSCEPQCRRKLVSLIFMQKPGLYTFIFCAWHSTKSDFVCRRFANLAHRLLWRADPRLMVYLCALCFITGDFILFNVNYMEKVVWARNEPCNRTNYNIDSR